MWQNHVTSEHRSINSPFLSALLFLSHLHLSSLISLTRNSSTKLNAPYQTFTISLLKMKSATQFSQICLPGSGDPCSPRLQTIVVFNQERMSNSVNILFCSGGNMMFFFYTVYIINCISGIVSVQLTLGLLGINLTCSRYIFLVL